jgi:hypothetical protein
MRIATFLGATSAAAMAAAAPLQANETIAYSYDARGRLIQVARTGTVNNGVTTSYTIDKADNRTSLWIGTGSPPAPPPPPSPPPPGPSFAISDASGTEGGVSHYFTVTRSGDASAAASVSFYTVNGSALAGSDYYTAGSPLSFAANETSKVLSIQTIADGITEGPETFFMKIKDPSSGATIADDSGTGTITDSAGTNTPPVANGDSVTVAKCSYSSVNVLANDTDANGDLPLTLTSVDPSSGVSNAALAGGGNVEIEGGETNGTGTHSYTITDSRGATATGTITVTVSGGSCL